MIRVREDEMIDDRPTPPAGPCARTIAAAFGVMALIAFLAVPVVKTELRLREDPVTKMVTRTTFPRQTTMFLPRVLASNERHGPQRTVRVRTTQWLVTLAIVGFLGLLDYGLFCRLLRRRRPGQIPPS
jgi:hypothetical protein